MVKSATDYKQQNWKVKQNFSNPFNCDVAPLRDKDLKGAAALK